MRPVGLEDYAVFVYRNCPSAVDLIIGHRARPWSGLHWASQKYEACYQCSLFHRACPFSCTAIPFPAAQRHKMRLHNMCSAIGRRSQKIPEAAIYASISQQRTIFSSLEGPSCISPVNQKICPNQSALLLLRRSNAHIVGFSHCHQRTNTRLSV